MKAHEYSESGSGFCGRCDDMPGEGQHRIGFQRILRSTEALTDELAEARMKAHEKHSDNSIESLDSESRMWLPILGEEGGEVAEVLVDMFRGAILAKAIGRVAHDETYDATYNLRNELIDVLSVATAWVASIDEMQRKVDHHAKQLEAWENREGF